MIKKGFTLVELIVVITILSILLTILYSSLVNENEKLVIDNSSNVSVGTNCFKTSEGLLSCDKSSDVIVKNSGSISSNYISSITINDEFLNSTTGSFLDFFVIIFKFFLPFLLLLLPVAIFFSILKNL